MVSPELPGDYGDTMLKPVCRSTLGAASRPSFGSPVARHAVGDGVPRPLRQALDRADRQIDQIIDAAKLKAPREAAQKTRFNPSEPALRRRLVAAELVAPILERGTDVAQASSLRKRSGTVPVAGWKPALHPKAAPR
jgi:hypothetical protein